MTKELKLEYYPKLDDIKLKESLNIIKKNRDKWESPFFFDTKSYLNLNQIILTSKLLRSEDIKNVIGRIQIS